MPVERIRYCGRYVYDDELALLRALRRASDLLATEDSSAFVEQGTMLVINLAVPATQEHRFVAANLFLALAHGAMSGTFHKGVAVATK